MPRQFLNPDGTPATFGVRQGPERGLEPGVVIHTPEERETMASKAEKSGIYTLNGLRFKIAAGDVLPDGAQMAQDAPDERKRLETPENRAKGVAPENRAAKKAEK